MCFLCIQDVWLPVQTQRPRDSATAAVMPALQVPQALHSPRPQVRPHTQTCLLLRIRRSNCWKCPLATVLRSPRFYYGKIDHRSCSVCSVRLRSSVRLETFTQRGNSLPVNITSVLNITSVAHVRCSQSLPQWRLQSKNLPWRHSWW